MEDVTNQIIAADFEQTNAPEPEKRKIGRPKKVAPVNTRVQVPALNALMPSGVRLGTVKGEDLVVILAKRTSDPPPTIGHFKFSEQFGHYNEGNLYRVPRGVAAALREAKIAIGG